MATINSNQITIVDITDSRKLDVYITSNLPTTQIRNANTGAYSPDWSVTNLQLSADIYLDSIKITPESIEWYTKIGTTKTVVGSNINLTVQTNVLDLNPIITYGCRVTYQTIEAFNEITFTRVDTGLNGSNGNSAPSVSAQYSADGLTWSTELDSSLHKYIRFSYDNGAHWTTAIKIAGEDGTSVTIVGTAYYDGTLSNNHIGQNVILYSDADLTTIADATSLSTGDAYITQGYLCVYNEAAAAFICTGVIQGPPGAAGISSYMFIRYATDANGANMSDNPSGKTYVGFYTSSANSAPTEARFYTWRKFVGDNAKSIVLSGDAQIFKVNKANVLTPATITVTAQAINTTIPDSGWTYSVNGGQTFLSTAPAGVSRNGNTITIAGETMTASSIVIKASDGTYNDIFTVYKVFDGTDGAPGAAGQSASMAFLTNENVSFGANANGQVATTTFTTNVVAYNGTTKVAPTIGEITGLPAGMTVSAPIITAEEGILTFSIANNATLGVAASTSGTITIPVTSPVSTNLKLSWSKINTGATGTSASLVDITPSAYYFKSTTGKDGTFTPDYIYVYPRFQNVTFSKWEYSVDGGITWVAASGANGLTISTYSSIANTLRIARTSTLYTDTVTSISFRCISSNTSVYDTVSIAKLFDVDVEEINTRITDGFAEVKTTTDSIISKANSTEQTVATINNSLSSITTRVSNAEQKITPTAIVSTVRQSADYTNDLGKKVNSSEIISKINQTAESVTISANKIGLLGATNIPDLTADKIKGGTLTLGGSSATTQNGQLLVKNASNVDMLKVNKDGLVVKSGHLAVAEDFASSSYDWNTGVWTTTTNTSQLDLGDDYIQMGVYSPSGYSNTMRLLDDGLRFQGIAQGIGSWGSFVGHDSLGDFVINDERGNILLNSAGLTIGGPISGGVASGNAKLLTNILCKNFTGQPIGYLAIRLGSTNIALNSMITIKGNITSYNNSTSFSASCYYYGDQGVFYAPIVDISNPVSAREAYFAEKNGYVYLILGAPSEVWYYPTISVESVSIGYAGHTSEHWSYNWDAEAVANLSSFTRVAQCSRIALNQTIWSGTTQASTITLSESYKNFRFLTCVLGDPSSLWGITLGAYWDDALSELHFGAIFTDGSTGTAGSNFYGANFKINSPTSLTLVKCGTKNGVAGSYLKKIVGWR